MSQGHKVINGSTSVYRARSLEQCQGACLNTPGCDGVEWDLKEGNYRCKMSGPWAPATYAAYDRNITYYKLNRNCTSPTIKSSKRCSSRLHLYNVRHIKAALAVCCRDNHIAYTFYPVAALAFLSGEAKGGNTFSGGQVYMVAHNALPQYGTHTPLFQVSLPFS